MKKIRKKVGKKIKQKLEPEAPPIDVAQEFECLNCGHRSVGVFCSLCGQAADVERYAFGSLLRELYQGLRKVDISATFVTIIELLKRPSEFLRGYLAGRRVGYAGPIKFFFYALIADILIRQLLQWITGDLSYAASTTADSKMQVLGLISTIIWSVFWRLLYWNSELTLAELAVCAIYFESEINFLSTVVLVLLALFRHRLYGEVDSVFITDLLLTFGYSLYLSRKLFGESWWKVATKQSLLLVLYVLVIIIALFGNLVFEALVIALS